MSQGFISCPYHSTLEIQLMVSHDAEFHLQPPGKDSHLSSLSLARFSSFQLEDKCPIFFLTIGQVFLSTSRALLHFWGKKKLRDEVFHGFLISFAVILLFDNFIQVHGALCLTQPSFPLTNLLSMLYMNIEHSSHTSLLFISPLHNFAHEGSTFCHTYPYNAINHCFSHQGSHCCSSSTCYLERRNGVCKVQSWKAIVAFYLPAACTETFGPMSAVRTFVG